LLPIWELLEGQPSLSFAFGGYGVFGMLMFSSILLAIGLVAWFAGELRLLVLAYRQSWLWFFGCLFVPFVSWIFFLFNVRQAWKPMVMALGGFILAGVGYLAGGFRYSQ
jgi:hypothetical protein